MKTADDIGRLKQEAIETIVFHATPREWLQQIGGAWVLERGEGGLHYVVEVTYHPAADGATPVSNPPRGPRA